jgi:hypothetical protein
MNSLSVAITVPAGFICAFGFDNNLFPYHLKLDARMILLASLL